jgi:oxaloacetate decarboxylase alpha subunit
MDEIRIVDTTLRDGNTSLWAHNMTTGMMHPVLSHMDQAGFEAVEFLSAAVLTKSSGSSGTILGTGYVTATRK